MWRLWWMLFSALMKSSLPSKNINLIDEIVNGGLNGE
jgi:hypothetical protein